jgi:DNA-binding CsgD family transcriptional regulator
VPEALAHAQTVIAAPGETPGERALLANAAVIKTLSGAPRDDVRPLVERAWSNGALLSDEGPEGHLWSLLTAALTWNDWHADSAKIAHAVLDEARRQGALLAAATANYVLGGPDYRRGRIADAIAELETALDARADGWGAYAGAAASLLALCLIERGDLERATEAVPDPDDPRWADTLEQPLVLEGRAAVELATGRNEQALRDYVRLGELAESQHAAANPLVLPWHSGAALAAIRLGDPDRARELIDRGLELALRVGAPSGVARLRWIEGLLLGGSPGLDAMREAVCMLDASEPTLEHLRALVEFGAALRRANRRAEARAPLERARELATLRGANGLAARAADELRAAGARPRRIVLSGVQALTGSELRIAHLAAAGRSNRQIAEELFVTIKAVEFHLGNTYRKLAIQGRRELAAALSSDQESTSFVAQ